MELQNPTRRGTRQPRNRLGRRGGAPAPADHVPVGHGPGRGAGRSWGRVEVRPAGASGLGDCGRRLRLETSGDVGSLGLTEGRARALRVGASHDLYDYPWQTYWPVPRRSLSRGSGRHRVLRRVQPILGSLGGNGGRRELKGFGVKEVDVLALPLLRLWLSPHW